MMKITLQLGDICTTQAQAIVYPANSALVMNVGVGQALKLQGGQSIEDEARLQAPCAVGQAVVTTAGALPAQAVIHAPTMQHPNEPIPPKQVELATMAALRTADEAGFTTIAMAHLGGDGGDVDDAETARIMIETIQLYMVDEQLAAVEIYLLTEPAYEAFTHQLQ